MGSEIKGTTSQPPPPPRPTEGPRPPLRTQEKPERQEDGEHAGRHRGITAESSEERMGRRVAAFARKLLGRDWMHDLEKHENEDKVAERFQKLSRSLGKVFGEATPVDRAVGEGEMKEAGLKRVQHDLVKLFRASGFDKELSREFAREVAETLASSEGAEVLQVSLATAQLIRLEASQTGGSYLSGTQGTAVAVNETSFELAAVRFRSLDLSINLATGELSMQQTSLDVVSIQSSQASLLAGSADASGPLREILGPIGAAPAPATASTEPLVSGPVPAAQGEVPAEATIVTESEPESPDSPAETFFQAVGWLSQSVQQLETFLHLAENRFETSFAIRNPREEEDDEGHRHLHFTLDAAVPVGLTERNEEGRGTTVYPRPEGGLGRITDAAVDVSV